MGDPFSTETLIAAAHHCAMEMMNNALYIRKEIPGVEFPPGIKETLSGACGAMLEAKLDLVSDLHALDEQVVAPLESVLCSSAFHRILARLDEAALLLHPAVVALKEAAGLEKRFQLTYLLVAESAVNVLNAHAAIHRPEENIS